MEPGQGDNSKEEDKGCASFKSLRLGNYYTFAMDPDKSMKLNEGFCEELKLEIEYNDNLQSILKRSNP